MRITASSKQTIRAFINETIKLIKENDGATLQQLKRDIEDAFGVDTEKKNNSTTHQSHKTEKKNKQSANDSNSTLDVNIVSPGFKIKNRDTGTLYTVKRVVGDAVLIKTPEGDTLKIDTKKFEKTYERA